MLYNDIKNEVTASVQLGSPLVAALLTQLTLELVNTIMLGRLGIENLAAGGLGIAIFFTFRVLCNGIFSATGVLIARNLGARNHDEIRNILLQSLYLSLMLSIPLIFILRMIPHFLIYINEPIEIIRLVSPYVNALSWGFPPLVACLALREFVVAMSYSKLIMILSLMLAPLAAVFNYILIYGKCGFPVMGIAGVGYSTALMEWILLFVMLGFIFKNKMLRFYFPSPIMMAINFKKIIEIVKLGMPVSITMGFEVGLFSVTTILMGYFGSAALAAHQVALQCATLAFMFPLGIAQATAIRVGLNYGSGSRMKAKTAGYVGLALGLLCAVMTAVVFLCFSEQIIHIFINDNDPNKSWIIPMASSFMIVMALFQLLDAMQVIMNGALRGLKDTFVPMWLGLLSYWISGLMSGYCLAFVFKVGAIGLWWGLGIGVGFSGFLLLLRFRSRIKAEVPEVLITLT